MKREEMEYRPQELTQEKAPLRVWPGGILIILLGTILSGIIYNGIVHEENEDLKTPRARLESSFQEGYFMVEVVEMDDTVAISSLEYNLRQGNGSAVPGVLGDLDDIYGLDIGQGPYNISYVDSETDGELSPGDYFIISSLGNAPAREGSLFSVVFRRTGEDIGMAELELKARDEKLPVPTTSWNVTIIEEDNITFDEQQPAATRFTFICPTPVNLSLDFEYTGNGKTNFSLTFLQGNKILEERVLWAMEPGEEIHEELEIYEPNIESGPGERYVVMDYHLTVRDRDSNQTLLELTLSLPYCDWYPVIC